MKFLLYLAALLAVSASCGSGDPKPVIGLLTQPSESDFASYGDQYVPASYVKWIESAGARVAFVQYDSPQADLQTLLATQLNGLVFPGGSSDIDSGPFADATRFLLNTVMSLNAKGIYFPLWGTCQGFQQICVYTAQNSSVLVEREAENILFPLLFTNLAESSNIIGNAPQTTVSNLKSENITVNNHHYGVPPSEFTQNANLAATFNLLSTNVDVYGYTFASLIEGKMGLPIWGSAFHPEKPAYEWDQGWTNVTGAHSPDAIDASQYFIDFFMKQARKNQGCYADGVNGAGRLAYWYNPVYTGAQIANFFDQCYFFSNQK